MPLAILRIGLAAALLLQAWMCRSQFFEFYGSHGILQSDLGERFGRSGIIRLSQLVHWGVSHGLTEKGALGWLGGLYLAALLSLLVGFF